MINPEDQMLKDPEYTMYSKEGCIWCDRLRELLIERGVDHLEIKVDYSVENLDELKSRLPDVRTVPQLFHGEAYVGGYEAAVRHFTNMDKTDADHQE